MKRSDATMALADRFVVVRNEANNSRSGSREALQQFVGEYPKLSALFAKEYGNAAKRAEESLVRYASGGNVLVDESTRIWLTEVQSALAEPGDTGLEMMLAHRVALCWLTVNATESLRAEKWKNSMATDAADFWDRHTSRVQGDFLNACRTLATVRKLRRPVLQMNIAEKQINVVG